MQELVSTECSSCFSESRSCTSHVHKCTRPMHPGASEHQTIRFLHVQILHNHHWCVFRRAMKAYPYPLQPAEVSHLLKCYFRPHKHAFQKQSGNLFLLPATVTSYLLASTPSAPCVCSLLELCFADVRKHPRCSVLMSLLTRVFCIPDPGFIR